VVAALDSRLRGNDTVDEPMHLTWGACLFPPDSSV